MTYDRHRHGVFEDLDREPTMVMRMACGLYLDPRVERASNPNPAMLRAAVGLLDRAAVHPSVNYRMTDEDAALWNLVAGSIVDENGVTYKDEAA